MADQRREAAGLPVPSAAEQQARDLRIYSELLVLFNSAARDLTEQALAALARGAVGSAGFQQRQLAGVQSVLQRLADQAVPEMARATVSAYEMGATDVVVEATEQGLSVAVRGGFGGGVHLEAVKLLVDNSTSRITDVVQRVGRQVEDLFRQVALDRVAHAVATATPRRELTAQIADTLTQRGVEAFIDAAGRRWGMERYAEMVARTTVREAQVRGRVNRLLENGLDAVRISSHTHEPDVCTPYDGRAFSLEGRTTGLPILDRLPPFHPNCRHTLTAARPGSW